MLRTHGTIERLPRGHRILGAVAVCAIAVGLSSCGSAPSQSDNPGASVADVSSGMGSPLGSNRLGASSRARVRNESSSQADVVMQFVRDSRVIHEAFARVLPNTVTTVTSPANIDYVELSGIDGRGDVLAKEVFVFGVDFDSGVPAEYVIFDADDPLAGSAIPPIEMQREAVATSLRVVEPNSDVLRVVGSTLSVRWDDTNNREDAFISLFLRAVNLGSDSERRPVGPTTNASLDGTNDTAEFVIQGFGVGTYEVIAEIVDGDQTVTAVADGLLRIVQPPAGTPNDAPSIQITSPLSVTSLESNELLSVSWTDSDADDNATIIFSLEAIAGEGNAATSFVISSPIPEDPDDGDNFGDNAELSIAHVHPGVYDLVASIDDGRLRGEDRVAGVVVVLPEAVNDSPVFEFLVPMADTTVTVGGTLGVMWRDSDEDDDAKISIFLDAVRSSSHLDDGEIVLISDLSEDPDGVADLASLSLPADIAPAFYRLGAVITDGSSNVVTYSQFIIRVQSSGVGVGDGGGDGGGGGGGVGPGDDVGGDDPVDNNGGPGGGGSGGGGGDSSVDAPDSDLTVNGVAASDSVRISGDDSVDVALDVDAAGDGLIGAVFLSNLRYGGNLRIDVTSAATGRVSTATVRLDISRLPYYAFPGTFDIELEVTRNGETAITTLSQPITVTR